MLDKAHFHDLFKKTLEKIEDEFDKDFKAGFPTDLKGMDNLEVRITLQRHIGQICEGIWDKEHDPTNLKQTLYERLIYELIIFLLYLKKEEQ